MLDLTKFILSSETIDNDCEEINALSLLILNQRKEYNLSVRNFVHFYDEGFLGLLPIPQNHAEDANLSIYFVLELMMGVAFDEYKVSSFSSTIFFDDDTDEDVDFYGEESVDKDYVEGMKRLNYEEEIKRLEYFGSEADKVIKELLEGGWEEASFDYVEIVCDEFKGLDADEKENIENCFGMMFINENTLASWYIYYEFDYNESFNLCDIEWLIEEFSNKVHLRDNVILSKKIKCIDASNIMYDSLMSTFHTELEVMF